MTGREKIEVTQSLEDWAEGLIERTVSHSVAGVEGKLQAHMDKVVADAVALGIERHMNTCPVREQVRKLEVKLSSLIAFMVGSGLLGGGVSFGLSKVFGL